jgi:hypothetical protein
VVVIQSLETIAGNVENPEIRKDAQKISGSYPAQLLTRTTFRIQVSGVPGWM